MTEIEKEKPKTKITIERSMDSDEIVITASIKRNNGTVSYVRAVAPIDARPSIIRQMAKKLKQDLIIHCAKRIIFRG